MRNRVTRSKKVTLDGITFQSGLEANFYNQALNQKLSMDYEKHSFVLASEEAMTFDFYKKHGKNFIKSNASIKPITYTPDFVMVDDNFFIVVECKGNANERYPIVRSLFLRYLNALKKPAFFFEPRTKAHNTLTINHIIKIINGDWR